MTRGRTIDYDPSEVLLEEARSHLAKGELEDARRLFEEVLERRPRDPRAELGLGYIGRKSIVPPGPNEAAILSLDLRVVKLVKEKRYAEALGMLEQARALRPNDETLLRSVEHLKRHLGRPSTLPPPPNTPSRPKPSLPSAGQTPSSEPTKPFDLSDVAVPRRIPPKPTVSKEEKAKPTVEPKASEAPAKEPSESTAPFELSVPSRPPPAVEAQDEGVLVETEPSSGATRLEESHPTPRTVAEEPASGRFWPYLVALLSALAVWYFTRR